MQGAVAEFLTEVAMRHPEDMQASMLEKLKLRSTESREEAFVRIYNDTVGDLTGYDCEICKNKGRIAYLSDDMYNKTKACSCMPLRIFNENMDKSGLKDLFEIYNFKNYDVAEEWQQNIKYKALKYTADFGKKNDALKWFAAFGAVGSGKTHICTAICGEILKNGGKVAYMLWREESVRLKASINDDVEYMRIFKPYKEAKTLYIDDLFKTESGKNPSEADIKLAHELINHRYNKPNTKTVISSEKTFDEILELDEATGSRISQRCTEEYRLKIRAVEGRNWRLRA